MNKKISSVLMLTLVSVMLLGLVGCGNKEVNDTPVQNPPIEDVNTPVEDNTDVVEPVDVSIKDIVNTMKLTYGELYLPNGQFDAETFNNTTGLTSDMYSEFYAEVPMMGFNVDKLFIVRTDNVDAVKSALENYMKVQIEDSFQYPINIPRLENYTIYTNQDYVILFILGGSTNEMVEDDGTKTPEEIEKANTELQLNHITLQKDKGLAALEDLFVNGYNGPDEVIAGPNIEDLEGEDVSAPTEGPNATDGSEGSVDSSMSSDTIESETVTTGSSPGSVDTSSDFS